MIVRRISQLSYLTKLFQLHVIISNGTMATIDELQEMWMYASEACFKILFRHLSGAIE